MKNVIFQQYLLKGGVYLRSGAYQRKYSIQYVSQTNEIEVSK